MLVTEDGGIDSNIDVVDTNVNFEVSELARIGRQLARRVWNCVHDATISCITPFDTPLLSSYTTLTRTFARNDASIQRSASRHLTAICKFLDVQRGEHWFAYQLTLPDMGFSESVRSGLRLTPNKKWHL